MRYRFTYKRKVTEKRASRIERMTFFRVFGKEPTQEDLLEIVRKHCQGDIIEDTIEIVKVIE